MRRAVELAGAVPAMAAVVRGQPTLGLTADELERFLAREGVEKVSSRDLAPCIVHARDGATTVAASLALMSRWSEARVFATGGIGGVHRQAPYDESADLLELARTPVVVVCAGAKVILDLPATLERLESFGVPVIGYRTREFPAFFTESSGLPVPAAADSATEIAAMARAHWDLGRREAMLVVQPPPAAAALPRDTVEAAVAAALADAARTGVQGPAVTPFLLAAVERATEGRSRIANLALLEHNAALAAHVARALHS
jgi:pseudouridine-5'-phosphate glycosidase